MKMTFRVKIKDDGSFKLPVADGSYSSEPKHKRYNDHFIRDAHKLCRNKENRKFFNGSTFNTNNLPKEISITESAFISTVEVNVN